MKARYLFRFSYIGTGFRASEKLWRKEGTNHIDPSSIQGIFEIALLKLNSVNFPKVNLSSRTDGGVHALNTSAHVDLERQNAATYDPDRITYNLNKFFRRNECSIHIKKCLRVPDTFNARHSALSRTYLYRLAVLKKDVELSDPTSLSSLVPVEEWNRCHFLRLPNFDIERMKEGCKYFPGYHDFSTFKKFDKLTSNKQNRRLIYSVDVFPGRPMVTSYTEESCFDYWDVYIRGKGFVHNQIRRMMGALLGVATGKLPTEEIKVMLQVPSKHSWPTHLSNCPPYGLYLCNVEYDPKDLICDTNCEEDNVLETGQKCV